MIAADPESFTKRSIITYLITIHNTLHDPKPSSFYVVQHHFKPGQCDKWWVKADELLFDAEAASARDEKYASLGFKNHSFNPTGQAVSGNPGAERRGAIVCSWEVRLGVTASEFQDFLDGPEGLNLGLDALINVIHRVDLRLTGGATPHPRALS